MVVESVTIGVVVSAGGVIIESVAIGMVVSAGGVVVAAKMVVVTIVTVCVNELIYNS